MTPLGGINKEEDAEEEKEEETLTLKILLICSLSTYCWNGHDSPFTRAV